LREQFRCSAQQGRPGHDQEAAENVKPHHPAHA
jgi:hypothetical protein